MTADIDIDSIMKGLSSPEVGKNADSLIGMVKEVNTVLKEVQKTVDFLDKCGIKPLLVRGIGMKMGIDVDSPLAAEKKGFEPSTATHANIYNRLNVMSEKEVCELFTVPEVIEEIKEDV